MEEVGKDRGSERTMKKLGVRIGIIDLKNGWEMIGQGAEARIYRGTLNGRKAVAKQRFIKRYRHPLLDVQLTRERIRAEARCLVKCRAAGM
jgi:TP53 regulating kinase-like protein